MPIGSATSGKKAVRKEWIEDLVVHATMKMLMNDATVDAIVAALMELQNAENSLLPLYEKQLRDTNTAIRNLLSAIEQGLLTRSTKERLDELEAARDNLESKIACEKLSKPRISEEQLRFFLHRFRSMNVEQQSQRKMLIDTFVNAIFLYDDRLVITYNFHDGSETITLNDLHLVEKKSKSGSDIRLVGEPRRIHGLWVLFLLSREEPCTGQLGFAKLFGGGSAAPFPVHDRV